MTSICGRWGWGVGVGGLCVMGVGVGAVCDGGRGGAVCDGNSTWEVVIIAVN